MRCVRFLESLSQALDSYLTKMSGFELLKAVYHLCMLGHFPPAPLQQLLHSSMLEHFKTTGLIYILLLLLLLFFPVLLLLLLLLLLFLIPLLFPFLLVLLHPPPTPPPLIFLSSLCLNLPRQLPGSSPTRSGCSGRWTCASAWSAPPSRSPWKCRRSCWETPPPGRRHRRPGRGCRRACGACWRSGPTRHWRRRCWWRTFTLWVKEDGGHVCLFSNRQVNLLPLKDGVA